MIDPTNTVFSTRYNIQKIYENDNASFSIPSTPSLPANILITTHNLGYIPTARVFYEPVAGELWPISFDYFDSFDGGGGTTLDILGAPYVTTSGLYIDFFNFSGSTQSVRVYWRIYLDE